jgi:hypothetical protein
VPTVVRGLLRRRRWKLGVTVINFFMVKFLDVLGKGAGPCLHHEGIEGCGGMDPHVLNLGTRVRCVAAAVSTEKNPGTVECEASFDPEPLSTFWRRYYRSFRPIARTLRITRTPNFSAFLLKYR